MLIGDKSRFAVEWQERFRSEGRKYLHFRFWSQNIAIGNYDDDVMESIVTGYMRDFLQHQTVREAHPVPDYLDSAAIYIKLYESYYSDTSGRRVDTNELFKGDSLNLCLTFHLTDIGGTGFDGVGIMACTTEDGEQLLIWKDHHQEKVSETHLPSNCIEGVFENFLKAIAV